jgi:glycosyltransferase involved in cell wall biosynthesis
MLSIIIPTLNEEDYLPFLLESIKKQKFNNYEIIVADAGSKDKTIEIAKKYGCTVIPGGLPAKGRNNGAKAAKGDILFFIDADTVLPDDFFNKSLEEFNERKMDIASFCLHPFPKKKLSYFLINTFYNKMIVALEGILPHSAVGILVKKRFFENLKGYDETIKLAEDHDLARRAVKSDKNRNLYKGKKGDKFGIIRATEILVSDRRWRKEGWAKIGAKYFLCELHMIFIGPVKSDIFNYKFNHYKDEIRNTKS